MNVICPSCGAPGVAGARFCSNCGESLALVCPECHAQVPGGSRFCPSCGVAMESAVQETVAGIEERKVVSVLFADLVGFTALTAQSDPEEVRVRLTMYHREIREDVERFGGRVEKLMGDGVFAVFGAPAAHEDDPERAVRAALRVQRSVEDLNATDPELSLSVRIAVTTGEAIVQLSNDDPDREGIIGDVVNTASRLEAVAPPGGIVVDERTYLATRDSVIYADLDPVQVKGKLGPLPIWRPTAARSRFGVAVEERHTTPFVGRDAELGILGGAFERTVREGTIQLVTVIGEPGVGKSRLLHQFRETIDARSNLVWWRQGRCLPYGEGITFWALSEIVKAHAGILESATESDVRVKLHAAVKALIADPPTVEWVRARLAPLAGVGSADAAADQAELFSAWSRFFEALAARNPLVMVVEDLHWADDAMLDFLEHLTEWAVASPILVVTTARPELFALRSTWGGGKRNATTITLSPLSHEHAAVLLDALLESTELECDVQRAILDRSEGNPLYVTEFVRLADDRGLLQDATGIADLPLPGSVQAIVAARLDLLEMEEKAALQAAAVVGKVFWMGALRSLRPALASSTLLRGLIRRELIRPVRDSSMQGQEEYTFFHSLIREVAYGQIPRGERAQLHEAAAGWIEAVTGSQGTDAAELLAFHLGEAIALAAAPGPELRLRAYRVNMQAGERVLGLSPFRGAGYFRVAAEMAEAGPDRASALLELGRAGQGDPEKILPIYDEALALFREAADIEGQAMVLDAMGSFLWWRGDTSASDARALEAVELVAELPVSEAKARVLVGRAGGLFLRGRAAEALDFAERAAPVVAAAGTAHDQVRLLSARGGALVELGDSAGVDYLEEAAALALDRNMTGAATTALNNLATVVAQMRSTGEAIVVIDKQLDLAAERGLPFSVAWGRFTKSEILVPMGRWNEVLELTDQVLRRDAEWGGSQAGQGAAAIRAMVLLYRGREQEARDLFGPLLESAREIQDQQVLVPALSFAVTLAHDAGEGDAVLALSEEFERVTADAPAFRSYYLAGVTASLAASGELEVLERLVGSSHAVGALGAVQVARARGHLESARGNPGGAAAQFGRAVGLAESAGRLVDATVARIEWAAALVAAGATDGVAALLAEARRTTEAIGAPKLTVWIDAVMGEQQAARASRG